jgi:hypothetical protein
MPDYSVGEQRLRRSISDDHLLTSLDLIRFASASI